MEGETARQEAKRLVSMSIYPNADVDGALVDVVASLINLAGVWHADPPSRDNVLSDELLDQCQDVFTALSRFKRHTHA